MAAPRQRSAVNATNHRPKLIAVVHDLSDVETDTGDVFPFKSYDLLDEENDMLSWWKRSFDFIDIWAKYYNCRSNDWVLIALVMITILPSKLSTEISVGLHTKWFKDGEKVMLIKIN